MRHPRAVFLPSCLFALWALPLHAQTATQPQAALDARREAYFQKTQLEAYNTIGIRDPKWDDNARKALTLAPKRWVGATRFTDDDFCILYYSDQAIAAGCDDPAVLYLNFRTRVSIDLVVPKQTLDALDRTVANSKYAPYVKAYIYVRLAWLERQVGPKPSPETLPRLLEAFYKTLPGVVDTPEFPRRKIIEMCLDTTSDAKGLYGDRKESLDRILEILQKAKLDASTFETFKGLAYSYYAYDGRGSGYADTVAPAAAKLMTDRIAIAKESFKRALLADPHNGFAAAGMINALMAVDEGRDTVEKYFQIAIAADPDCLDAYNFKLNYLMPKWYGTEDDQLAVGRAALATKRYATSVPFCLLQAHKNLAEPRYFELYYGTAGLDKY